MIGAGGGVILTGTGSGVVMGTVGVYVGRSNGGVNELISIVSAAVVV